MRERARNAIRSNCTAQLLLRGTRGLFALALFATSGCSTANDSAADTIPTPSARPDAARAGEAERVRQFLDSIYPAEAVRYTYANALGATIDCVEFTQEPGVRELIGQGHSLDEILAPFENADSTQSAPPLALRRQCPEMTVPHVRLTADTIAAGGGLAAYRRAHSHHGPGNPGLDMNPTGGGITSTEANTIFGHVLATQLASNYGGQATLSVGSMPPNTSPFWDDSNGHIVGQIWVGGGSSSGFQTIEVGWKLFINALPDDKPVVPYLFFGATQDDYADFCEDNQLVQGSTCVTWVPNPSSLIIPGPFGTPLSPSLVDGAQSELTVTVQLDCVSSTFCTWDVAAGIPQQVGGKIGYFPRSAYGAGALATGPARSFITGGEVADYTMEPMGEAPLIFGSALYGDSAYVRDFGYYGATCNSHIVGSCPMAGCRLGAPGLGVPAVCGPSMVQTGSVVTTTRNEFTYNTTAPAGVSTWTNWFYYGSNLTSCQGSGCSQWTNGFEGSQQSAWFGGNNAGFDNSRGWAHSGLDNGWAFAAQSTTSVWNSINAGNIATGGWPVCAVQAWIAASSTIVPGYAKLDVWDQTSFTSPLAEVVLGAGSNGGWVLVTTPEFKAPPSGQLFFDVGIFNSPAVTQWVRVDDVSVVCAEEG